ncbi:MAG: hypothetical protein ACR2RF_00350 [Geminicoccaceae bacterium]
MAVENFPPPPPSLARGPEEILWLAQLIKTIVDTEVQAAVEASLVARGNVLQGVAVVNGVSSSVSVAASDATVSTVSVDSANATDLATVITLANEIKADVNTLVTDSNTAATLANELKSDLTQLITDLNALVTQFNALLTSERNAGQLAT